MTKNRLGVRGLEEGGGGGGTREIAIACEPNLTKLGSDPVDCNDTKPEHGTARGRGGGFGANI